MNMKKFLFALMAITVAFASCQKDDNDGGNDNGGNGNEGGGNGSDTEQTVTLEDLTSGMLVINGEQTPLTGIFVDEYSGYMMVTMTDVAGAESFDWLVENEAEYDSGAAEPLQPGVRRDDRDRRLCPVQHLCLRTAV